MTLDQVPYVGKYSNRMIECYVATSFRKWGITSAMTAAMILTDMVLEKKSPYEEIYNPSRNMVKPQILFNSCESIKIY